jgi:hypothetical protein
LTSAAATSSFSGRLRAPLSESFTRSPIRSAFGLSPCQIWVKLVGGAADANSLKNARNPWAARAWASIEE